jgi:hypothetical protein
MKFKEINESSLSRLWRHNEEHDCAALTAFRKTEGCGDEGEKEFTRKENLQRNKSLNVKLLSKDYSVTQLKGQYPEGGKVTKEISYFVVNQNDLPQKDFFDHIKELGEYFNQDSVLLIPKEAIQNKTKAYLYGTNKCPKNQIGYGKKFEFEKGKVGYKSPIYTSFVNGRPLIFENVFLTEDGMPGTGFGIWAVHSMAKKDWRELDI